MHQGTAVPKGAATVQMLYPKPPRHSPTLLVIVIEFGTGSICGFFWAAYHGWPPRTLRPPAPGGLPERCVRLPRVAYQNPATACQQVDW